jgi:hypothetical protein
MLTTEDRACQWGGCNGIARYRGQVEELHQKIFLKFQCGSCDHLFQVEQRERKVEDIRLVDGEGVRPLQAGEVLEFGDLVELEPPPNFRAGRVVHGRKVWASEAEQRKFWREIVAR